MIAYPEIKKGLPRCYAKEIAKRLKLKKSLKQIRRIRRVFYGKEKDMVYMQMILDEAIKWVKEIETANSEKEIIIRKYTSSK